MNILSLRDVCKSFDGYLANNHISFDVPQGSIFGILGPNGAGKTTLIRIITNVIGADSGSILFDGQPLEAAHQKQIGYMPEERGLYKKMEVGEHLIYLGRLKNLSKKEAQKKIDYWAEKLEIKTWWNKKIEELSKGMQQKVQFIATVLHEPKLLILDEPFSGLDPINSQMIQNEIFELQKKGTTILFSTHRMEQVEEICEEIVLINKGRNILQGKVHDIKQQFKENIFRIDYGCIPDETALNDIQIVEKNHSYFIFKIQPHETSNDVLRKLIERQITIQSFREILPSLNQIFITQVTRMNNHN
jgi:ABC-2 type transport system ATP-binding protein